MDSPKKEKKEKKEKKDKQDKIEKASSALPIASDSDKLPEVRVNGLNCKLQFVTVYNDQAELTYGDHRIAGVQDVVVYGLCKNMDTSSIRVAGGKGNAIILEVSHAKKFKKAEEKADPEGERKAQEVKEKHALVARLKEEVVRNDAERTWLDRYATRQARGGEHEKISSIMAPNDAANFMKFYAENLGRLDHKKAELEKTIEDVNGAISQLRATPAMSTPVVDPEQLEITIAIQAEEAGEIALELSYILKNASWEPSYEARVSSTSQKLALSYFGLITNRTTESWDDVQISLSTAKPTIGGTPPEVHTLKVQQKQKLMPVMSSRSMSNRLEAPARSASSASSVNPLFAQTFAGSPRSNDMSADDEDGGGRAPAPKPMGVLTTVVEAKATSVSFKIERKAKVPSDGSARKVVVDVFNLDAVFLYTIVPQLSQNAFLRGTCINNRGYPFIEGKLSVFMDGNFVTTSKMKEFFMHLGYDSAVQIDFKPPKNYQETRMTGIMSRANVDHTEHLTIIKNTKDFEIKVLMFEQCPRSEIEKIKVKIIMPEIKDSEKTVVLNDFNNVRWEFKVAAGGQQKVPYHFTIEYPNDLEVELRT